MLRKKVIPLLLSIVLCLCHHTALANEMDVKVDKHKLTVDDTLILQLTVSADSPQARPVMTDVMKSFDILGTSQSHQMAYINGQQSTKTQMSYRLAPKKSGTITIPKITWGHYQSTPFTIEVTTQPIVSAEAIAKEKAPPTAAKATKNVFMDITITPTSPYQDSQVIYTLKLFSAIPIPHGELSHPKSQDAWIYPETNDTRYEKTQQGKTYNVYERRYAIFPQKAGDIVIHSPTFVGQPVAPLFAQRSMLSNYDMKPIRLQLPSQKLTVKEKQTQDSESWLPAQEISLAQHWSDDLLELKVGEPVERTITLEAKGLTLTQLPDFSWADVNGIKIYPGKVSTNEHFDGKQVISYKTQTVTYIPTRSGDIHIPVLRLRWFNTAKATFEVSSLKSHDLTIAPTTLSAPVNLTVEDETLEVDQALPVTPVTAAAPTVTIDENMIAFNKSTLWQMLAGLATALVMVFGYGKLRRNKRLPVAPSQTSISPQEIKKACYQHNAARVRQLLHDYLQHTANLSKQNVQSLQRNMRSLDNLLYRDAAEKKKWNGKAFWGEIKCSLR